MLLVLIVIIPLLGLMAYDDIQAKNQKRLSVLNQSQKYAQNASLIYSQIMAEARLTLYHLSLLPEFQRQDPEACSKILAVFLKRQEKFNAILATKPNGDVFATAPAISKPLNIADRPWFQRLAQTREFVIGEYTIGRITGQPTVVLGYPVLDHTGSLVTILTAGLDIERLGETLKNIELPKGANLSVIDSDGTIILRFPDPMKLVGGKMPEHPVVKAMLTQVEGVQEGIGFDGRPRLFGFTTIGGNSETVHVSVSIPEQVAFEELRQQTIRNFALMGSISFLGLLGAWLFGRTWIISPVDRLVNFTKQMADGNLTVRTKPFPVSGEIGLLAHNFDRMAESLQKREEALRLSEERYRAFVKQSSEAICLFDLEQGPIDTALTIDKQIDILYAQAVIRECNQTFATSHGYGGPEEMIGFRIGQIFPRMARENVEYLRAFIENGHHIFDVETKELSRDGSIKYFLNSLIGHVENGRLLRVWGAKQDISRIKKVEEEIRTLNAELERRVAERTSELEAANRELEAFSYSVSHDLRAPLRAIDGFARILLEDFGPRLDAEGRRVCSVISENTRDMGKLIDDLLTLSRVGRSEVLRSSIDMAKLANAVFFELTTPEERGRIDFNVGPLPHAKGDPALIRQVWRNLLSNAVKFSAKKKRAVIEVSAELQEDGTVYTIQDNGAGFDMQNADKLFGVFQRLHSARKFEGTGVGLAIVQRIIHRHGGRVRAEGKPGEWATFSFTLR